ncbi:MAG: hypothetical protein ACNS62_13845 [Candidatus Cyclobacteriaceae bacterium M3_2C_046]
MLKIIILVILLSYIFFKVTGLIFRTIFKLMTGNDHPQNNRNQRKRRPEGANVDIDYVPNDHTKSGKRKDSRGGEYVEYEEVK